MRNQQEHLQKGSVFNQKETGRVVNYLILSLLVILIFSFLIVSFFNYREIALWALNLDTEFYLFILGGFIAQMVDGSLGMAYGASASAFLISLGISPVAASASIHTAEIFTSGISGLSHLKFQNVNKKLFKSLLIPGVLGAIIGAYVLSSFENYNSIIKPFISCYTLILGAMIIRKGIIKSIAKTKTKNISALASFGGFMDSVGGGGWGPIVTSTLIAKGRTPRYTIGSVNLAEFFISLASSLTFFLAIGVNYLNIIIGLIVGGAIAAPVAASITRKLPVRKMILFVGVTIVIVSLRSLLKSFL